MGKKEKRQDKCDHPVMLIVRLRGTKVRRQCAICHRMTKWEKVNPIVLGTIRDNLRPKKLGALAEGKSVKVKSKTDVRLPEIQPQPPTTLVEALNPDYQKMTVKELQDLLTTKGVTFKAKDTKAVLIGKVKADV